MKQHSRINTSPHGTRQPLIVLNIDLGKGKSDKIGIYRDSDPMSEAKRFVNRNKLQPTMVQVVSDSILKQMQAYDEMHDTYRETDYLNNIKLLKKNQLENQLSLKRLSPKMQKQSPPPKDELPTDRVVVKRLFQVLDSDQDGLISCKKLNHTAIPMDLRNIILNLIQNCVIPLEYEDLYTLLREQKQQVYFEQLRVFSEYLQIDKIKVLI